MRILWRNIFVFIFAVVVLVLVIKYHSAIGLAFSDIEHLGPGHSTDEKFTGLIALGFIGVSVVAIVKILTQDPK